MTRNNDITDICRHRRQTVKAYLAHPNRLAADGYDSTHRHLSPVATCRQTVETYLAPHHRLAADGYDSTHRHRRS